MSLGKSIKDSFVIGLITGLVSIVTVYYLVTAVRSLIVDYYGDPYMLRPPFVQLITMIINVIFFRVVMINYEKEKTGKGIFFITVMATLVYFFIFYRIKR
jgi:hypothetical protein